MPLLFSLLIFLAMLSVSYEADGAISYVQSTGAFSQYFGFGPNSVDIPVTADVAPGNSIIVTLVWGAWAAGETTMCSDTQGNSYAVDVSEFYGGSALYTVICSAHNVTALSSTDTITVSFSSNTYGVAAVAHEFSGLASSFTLDQTASANGNSATPSSGTTAVTAQTDELLIGAIGVSGPPADTFTPGAGYSALSFNGFSGVWNGTIRPEYKIVSVTGAYQADGALNPSRGWGAAIATYKAAAATTDITVSGTLYSDEGTTPLSGQTVRLLVEGASAGTDVTDASGNYSVTTTVDAGDLYIPALVYVDDGSVDGTTVTVMDATYATSVNDLHIYADHLVLRREGGWTPLENGDISAADGYYGDTDILYYVLGADLTVLGANTELYVAAGHIYEPRGNITTAHMKINGTLTAGSHIFTVSGDWTNNGTFTAGTSTVVLGGAGQQIAGSTGFHHFTKTVASADTLIFSAGTTQTITGTATLNGASGQLLSLRSGTPGTRWNFNLATGASKAISYVDVQDSDASGSDVSQLELNPAYSVDSGNNVSWFGSANITVAKSSAVVSDPINGAASPKRIPGAVIEYTVQVTNTGGAQATNVTITDDLGAESARMSFLPDGYGVPGKGILVTAPNINGGAAQLLTNVADTDQAEYSLSTITVNGITLDAGEQAVVAFRVVVR